MDKRTREARSALWQALSTRGLTRGELPEIDAPTPWPARIALGLCGWLAALFLVVFLLLLMRFGDNALPYLVLGVVMIVAARFGLQRDDVNEFLQQLALALSLAGQALVAVAVFLLTDQAWRPVAWSLAALQIALVFAVNNPLHRFLCALFAAASLTAAMWHSSVDGLAIVPILLVFTWLWLREVQWAEKRDLWEPVALALGFAVLALAGYVSADVAGLSMIARGTETEHLLLAGLVPLTALGCALWSVHELAASLGLPPARRRLWLAIGATISVLASATVPGAALSLLVLLIAYRHQRPILGVLAVLSVLALVSRHYYLLETTLLSKSLRLLVAGVILVLGAIVLSRVYRPAAARRRWQPALPNVRGGAVGLVALLALGVVAITVRGHERTLAEGRVVLLELAPVDPRSLMQGDYMRLRFAIANEIRAAVDGDEPPASAYVVVALDADGVGRFERIVTELPRDLAAGQAALRVRYRRGALKFATNAFFFEEGRAGEYDAARFGEFRVRDDGELLLRAMRDAEFAVIGENRPQG